ncbi:Zinc finger protein sens [Talaromyces islandicus]|uniref:Zinc finger protein sens n=1 Tax=Talaromyces islandicus TaxID=28573 RepID=A0A0U1LSD1_TALIS|nr:Zinc finger protein sens [Talaromyces islandicus]
MRIPNRTIEHYAPPPLPPPPRINDLEDGHDAGWLHANDMGRPDVAKLAPINPGSSLLGGHHPPEPIPRLDRMTLDESSYRTNDSFSHIKLEPPKPQEVGFGSSLSTTLSEPVLQGERDFSRKSVMSSSDNYDRHLLSKIGKPHSPPRGSYQQSSAYDSSFNLGIYTASSGGVSPRSKPAWTGYRSPSVESSAPSIGIDHDTYSSRRRPGTMTPQSEDTFSFHNRYNRTSQEQNVFPEPEGEDENDHFRHILDDRTQNGPDSLSRHHGMKRRASSPPREPVCDARQHTLHKATSNGDLSQRRTSGHPFTNHASPGARYAPSHGSMSSLSSASYRTSTSSFGSSVGLSVGGSSMTSTSSYDRISSGGLSPQSDGDHFYEKQQGTGGSLSSIQAPRAPYTSSADAKPVLSGRKVPMQSTVVNSRGIKLVGLYICDCCPKKPKRFDTEADLRAHESEKQYSCQYCNNRFKNKNEAERHQNSLHLRRHSWSCAALSGFQAAFHHSTAPTAQSNTGPTHDTCGYCGEEFPNNPKPDWDSRFEHLTTVHKFGECNNVKKFFRADHFRQHLKHSHAGTPGKWTNILENACMKDEPQVETRLGSISEQGTPKKSEMQDVNGAGSTTFTSNTIDEAMDES